MEATDVMKNISSTWLMIIVSISYCYFVSTKLPKGILRLFSLLPILCILSFLPLLLCSYFATAVTSFFISWICNLKLLLFAFDQGPLSCKKLSLPIFIVTAALPVKTRQENDPPKRMKVWFHLAIETLIFALSAEYMFSYKEATNPILLQLLYGCMLFMLIDIVVAYSGWIVKACTGLELEKPSNEPYLSTSLQDFWGRRWNLTVTNALRDTIYNPIRTTLEKILGKGRGPQFVGTLATFVVSGLMHELMIYQILRVTPSGEMLLFFVTNGVFVVIEIALKKGFKERLKLPWFVSGPLTIGIFMVTALRLFFPPLLNNGADVIVIEEFRVCGDYFIGKILDFTSSL